MDLVSFAAASAALLATPGPTNTLLATSGAVRGVRRSLPLLAAELAGYMTAIVLLCGTIGPTVAAMPAVEAALRLVVVAYLLHLALELWRHGAAEIEGAGPVTIRRVLLTTLLNPKGLVFAFTLLPQGTGTAELLPWLAVLAIEIAVFGAAWILAGSCLRRGLAGDVAPGLGYRASALALTVLAGMVGAHAFT